MTIFTLRPEISDKTSFRRLKVRLSSLLVTLVGSIGGLIIAGIILASSDAVWSEPVGSWLIGNK